MNENRTKSERGYYTDRDGEGTHIMCDNCGEYIGTVEEIAATLESKTCIVTHDFKCSNCGKQIGNVRNCEMYETCDGQQAWKSLNREVCDIPNFCPNCGAKVVK